MDKSSSLLNGLHNLPSSLRTLTVEEKSNSLTNLPELTKLPTTSRYNLRTLITDDNILKEKNFKVFDNFYQDNIQKCFMLPTETYPLNHTKLFEWVENKNLGYSEEWKFKFNKNLQHISFQSFYEQCCKISIELIEIIKTKSYTKVYLYLPLSPRKSNLWVALLQWKFIRNYISDILYTKDDFDKIPTNSLLIYCDDCIYSGVQVYSESGIFSTKVKLNVYCSCPFITDKGLNLLQKKLKENNYLTLIFPETCIIIKNTLEKSTFYFDHKLADSVSVYDDLIIKFIKGCENREFNDCPFPFYKTIEYTYKNVKISKIQVEFLLTRLDMILDIIDKK